MEVLLRVRGGNEWKMVKITLMTKVTLKLPETSLSSFKI